MALSPVQAGAMGRCEDLLIRNVMTWSPGGVGRQSLTTRDSMAIHQCGLSADVWHAEQGLGEWPERRPGVASGLSAGLARRLAGDDACGAVDVEYEKPDVS